MLTGRRTKLAIVIAILLIGAGAALMFRRAEPTETATATKSPAAPSSSKAGGSTPAEPTLAGRIEPYTGNYRPANDGQGNATPERPASFASATSGAAAQFEPPPKRPKDGGQGVARSSDPIERSAAVFDRFANHPPLPGRSTANQRHKITDGDTLAALARRYLGAEERYLDLFEHNRDVLETPELLPIGKELRIPPPDFVRRGEAAFESRATGLTAVAQPVAAPPESRRAPEARYTPAASTSPIPSAQTYVVQAHDTLALIARKVYGDIGRQAELMSANRQLLRTPQDLRPGMTLVVPQGEKPE